MADYNPVFAIIWWSKPANWSTRTLKLYDFALAPNPRRVRIFLAEKGIEVPMEQVNTREGAQFHPEPPLFGRTATQKAVVENWS